MNEFVSAINSIVWSPPLVFLCLGAGLYFSIRTRFLQLRHFGEMIRLIFSGKSTAAGISSFQALSMTLAGRVGTGNIAGVATAITFGGPGALFWMWVVAFLGASSAFVESTLGQLYKEKIHGEYRGGPAFYIEKGLGMKRYAWVFAVVTIVACGVLLPGVQANAISSSMQTAFDFPPGIRRSVRVSKRCRSDTEKDCGEHEQAEGRRVEELGGDLLCPSCAPAASGSLRQVEARYDSA